MNLHSQAFWHEQQHAFPIRPRPSTNLADLAPAPFTPSNAARGGGTIFPVIKNIMVGVPILLFLL